VIDAGAAESFDRRDTLVPAHGQILGPAGNGSRRPPP